jgi:hypothetical protein
MARIDDLDDPASPDGRQVLGPSSRTNWREWLASNVDRQEGLWVVYRKKSSSLDGPVSRSFWKRFSLPAVAASVGKPMQFHDLRRTYGALHRTRAERGLEL